MVASKDFFNHSMKRHYENVKLLLISVTIIRASTLQQREACRISNSGELHLGRVEDAACGVCALRFCCGRSVTMGAAPRSTIAASMAASWRELVVANLVLTYKTKTEEHSRWRGPAEN